MRRSIRCTLAFSECCCPPDGTLELVLLAEKDEKFGHDWLSACCNACSMLLPHAKVSDPQKAQSGVLMLDATLLHSDGER